MQPRRRNVALAVTGLAVWAACYLVIKKTPASNDYLRLVMSMPATFSAIAFLQFALARLSRLSEFLALIGQKSLQIFLLHQFFIGGIFVALLPLAADVSGEFLLIIMFIAVMASSFVAANILQKAPGNLFFDTPKLPLSLALSR